MVISIPNNKEIYLSMNTKSCDTWYLILVTSGYIKRYRDNRCFWGCMYLVDIPKDTYIAELGRLRVSVMSPLEAHPILQKT